MSTFGVVHDACVLVPPTLRDTLLRAARYSLYRLNWTEDILQEVEHSLLKIGVPEVPGAKEIVTRMSNAFPEATIMEDYKSLIPTMRNDPKDRHVLAAGVACHAQTIVTFNIRHFKSAALDPYCITAQTPDVFLLHLLDLNPRLMRRIITEQAHAYRNPPRDISDVLKRLEKFAPEFVNQLSESVWQNIPVRLPKLQDPARELRGAPDDEIE